jgi:ferredoxin-NADP reductase
MSIFSTIKTPIIKSMLNPKKTFQYPPNSISLTLIDKKIINHDIKNFRFSLPSSNHISGLFCGQYLILSYYDNLTNSIITRPYTPISDNENKGYIDFIITILPNDEKFTQYLNNMKIGTNLTFTGPIGNVYYKGNGIFNYGLTNIIYTSFGFMVKQPKELKPTNIGIVIWDIIPIISIINCILKEYKSNDIKISLLFINKSKNDIIINKLCKFLEADKNNFKVIYDVNFIDMEIFRSSIPKPDINTLILLSGSDNFIDDVIIPNMKEDGYTDNMYIKLTN